MANYQLSEAAREDLDHLYLDGILRHGLQQADGYYDGLIEQFEFLANNPEIGINSDELAPSLQKFRYRRHLIFFMKAGHSITIVRVLSERMDFEQHI